MRILVTGDTGQLGLNLVKLAPNLINESKVELITTSRKDLDFSCPSSCQKFIYDFRPDWVINAAAFTAVDAAESQVDLAYKINSESPYFIAKALKEIGGNMIYLSTDYVFNGLNSTPYKPYDPRDPLGVYGASKVQGEDKIQSLLKSSNQSIVLRTSWLMGPKGKNFALTMLRLIRERDTLNIVSDQIGSPTSTNSLSRLCWHLIEKSSKGGSLPSVLHWSDAGVASWYDIAYAIAELGKELNMIQDAADIFPINSSQYPTVAKRPNYSVLDITDTISEGDFYPIHWRKELKEILRQVSLI